MVESFRVHANSCPVVNCPRSRSRERQTKCFCPPLSLSFAANHAAGANVCGRSISQILFAVHRRRRCCCVCKSKLVYVFHFISQVSMLMCCGWKLYLFTGCNISGVVELLIGRPISAQSNLLSTYGRDQWLIQCDSNRNNSALRYTLVLHATNLFSWLGDGNFRDTPM
jgi:hypothetical protein